MSAKERILYGTVLLYFIVAVLPLLVMVAKSLFVDGHFTLEAYSELFSTPHRRHLLQNSLKLAFSVTVLTLAAGVPLGLLFGRFDMPLKRFFALLFIVPLLVPPYIWAVGWADLLAPGGVLVDMVDSVLPHRAYEHLFGFEGALFILSCVYLPIPMILTMVLLRSVNPNFEEAALLATGWPGVLKSVTLPLIAPGILLAAILVFLLSFGEITVPGFLRYDVYAVESFTAFSAFYDYTAATAYTAPMLALTLSLLLFEERFLRRGLERVGFGSALRGSLTIPLGAFKPVMPVLIALIVTVTVLTPFAALVWQSAGTDIYFEAFEQAGGSIGRTLIYALTGATLLTIFGFLTGYAVHTRSIGWWRFLDASTLFLFALPSTVVAIGLISLWNRPWSDFVYTTPLIVIMGFLAKYLVLPSRITAAQLALIPDSMEEAAQVAGAGWFRRMVYIVAPLAARGLAAAWLVAYIFIVRDTSVAMLLYPPGEDTLSVRIFTMMANGTSELIAALCLIMAAMSLVPAVILGFGVKRGGI